MPVSTLQADGNMVVTGSFDGTVRFYDLRQKVCLETLSSLFGGVSCLQCSEYHIITGHANGLVCHWDIRNTKWFQQSFLAHNRQVTCLKFDQTRLITGILFNTIFNLIFISGSADHTVALWDFRSFGSISDNMSHTSSFARSQYCNLL
jgi:WD40 repeat protein